MALVSLRSGKGCMAKSEAWGDMYKDHQNDQVKRGAVIEKRALEADCGQSSQEGKYESA